MQQARDAAKGPITTALEQHYAMMNAMKGVPGVRMDRWAESFQVPSGEARWGGIVFGCVCVGSGAPPGTGVDWC